MNESSIRFELSWTCRIIFFYLVTRLLSLRSKFDKNVFSLIIIIIPIRSSSLSPLGEEKIFLTETLWRPSMQMSSHIQSLSDNFCNNSFPQPNWISHTVIRPVARGTVCCSLSISLYSVHLCHQLRFLIYLNRIYYISFAFLPVLSSALFLLFFLKILQLRDVEKKWCCFIHFTEEGDEENANTGDRFSQRRNKTM